MIARPFHPAPAHLMGMVIRLHMAPRDMWCRTSTGWASIQLKKNTTIAFHT